MPTQIINNYNLKVKLPPSKKEKISILVKTSKKDKFGAYFPVGNKTLFIKWEMFNQNFTKRGKDIYELSIFHENSKMVKQVSECVKEMKKGEKTLRQIFNKFDGVVFLAAFEILASKENK